MIIDRNCDDRNYDNWKLQESPCSSAKAEEIENKLIVRLADLHQDALAAGLGSFARKLASILDTEDIEDAKYRTLGYGNRGEWPPVTIPWD